MTRYLYGCNVFCKACSPKRILALPDNLLSCSSKFSPPEKIRYLPSKIPAIEPNGRNVCEIFKRNVLCFSGPRRAESVSAAVSITV